MKKMMPVVVIVGRTNVGKSSLFNRLVGHRVSIVEEFSGVTRDRVSGFCRCDGGIFELIDTGGFGLGRGEELVEAVERQIELAMEGADLLLFVVDGKAGLTPLDREVAGRVKRLGRPYLLVVNKVDRPEDEVLVDDFHELGLGVEPYGVSALSGNGISLLREGIMERLCFTGEEGEIFRTEMRIAIVGRPNVGKSSLINALLGEPRMIVSEVPGTTRDAVDVRFEKDGKSFVAIDTAGVRRRRSVRETIDFYSLNRMEKAIARADVVIFMLDVSSPVTKADKKLADLVVASQKAVVVAANKWDLARGRITTSEYAEYLERCLPGLHFAPIVFITAKTGKNRHSLIQVAQELFKQSAHRVGTGELNRVVRRALERRRPRPRGGEQGKVYYATQVGIHPPTIVLFVNREDLFSRGYLRYLANRLREEFDFSEIPLRFILRERGRDSVVRS